MFATSLDKDATAMLEQLLPHFEHVVLTRYLNNPRATDPSSSGQRRGDPAIAPVVATHTARAARSRIGVAADRSSCRRASGVHHGVVLPGGGSPAACGSVPARHAEEFLAGGSTQGLRPLSRASFQIFHGALQLRVATGSPAGRDSPSPPPIVAEHVTSRRHSYNARYCSSVNTTSSPAEGRHPSRPLPWRCGPGGCSCRSDTSNWPWSI